jgi:hypothetical protein
MSGLQYRIESEGTSIGGNAALGRGCFSVSLLPRGFTVQ